MENIYGWQLLEQFRKGKKEFSDIHIQFGDLNGINLSGIIIRDSKLDFTGFRESILKNAKFINCDMFFVSFYGADMENAVIEKCRMEMMRFDNMCVKNTRIVHSNLSYSLMTNVALGELQLHDTSEFKVIRNLSEVNDEDAADGLRRLGMHIETLPIEMKLQLKQIVGKVLNEYDVSPKLASGQDRKSSYSAHSGSYSRSANIYGALNAIGEEITKYETSGPYKNKNKEDRKGVYG